LGAPQLFIRFMSIKSPEEIQRGKWVSLTLQFIMNVAAVTLGILGRALLTYPMQQVEEVLGNGGQDVLILLVEATLPLLLTGVYIAAVLAAIMSTIDSLLVLASSAVTRDLYQQVYRPSIPNARLSRLSRWVTLALAMLSLAVVMLVAVVSPTRTIFWFVIFGWSGLAASFCPVMVLSLFWHKFNEKGAIMLAGLILLPLAAFTELGGLDGVLFSLRSIDGELLKIWGPGGFSGINVARAAGFALIGLGYLGAPQLFIRFMSIKSPEEIHRGKWVSLTLQFIMNIAAVTLGILGRALLTNPMQQVEEVLGNGGQDVLILLAEATLPVLLTGLYIAAVLAAIMSTIDSLLVLASSAVTRDFYQQVYRPSIPNARLSRMSRWVTLALAFLSLAVAMLVALASPTRTIFWFVIFGWSGLAASFCPVMVLSLFWKKFNEKGAIAAMIVGFLGVPFFKFIMPSVPIIGEYFSKIAELFPSFLLALVAGWLATILSLKKSTD